MNNAELMHAALIKCHRAVVQLAAVVDVAGKVLIGLRAWGVSFSLVGFGRFSAARRLAYGDCQAETGEFSAVMVYGSLQLAAGKQLSDACCAVRFYPVL